MKNLNYLVILFLLLSGPISWGQKFKLESSVGSSRIMWYENQQTIDFSTQITFQKPNAKKLFFLRLKTYGNTHHSPVDLANYSFIEPQNTPTNLNELESAYRGGEAELGIKWQHKAKKVDPFFYPMVSIYSKSLARKISTPSYKYIEEEKYSLHGITAGFGLKIPGKNDFAISAQIFEPIIREVTLFGRYVGVPFQTLSTANDLSFKGKLEYKHQQIGATFMYELLNLGSSSNPNSKSIPASSVHFLSAYLTYYF
ncbi:hypothetical protein [Aquirufa aurantiipilula]|uniref:DUF2490 domain-containing protein n=1 Tax=Aquirufa aurantiipilula TaxID=2696561 RepID=A0ABT6BN13_9BACT|nr:hypothetical protein [Aquirufa aurantiipilula]MDF5691743.1 hypothetical protein [Aquirufa aurantiipilula]